MVKFLHSLLALSLLFIEMDIKSYAQQYSASLGMSPVGFVSRTGINGDREVYSSLGNANVGVYKKQEFPSWGSYVLPVIRPFYRPVYQPIYHPVYRPVFQPFLKPVPQTQLKVKVKPALKVKVVKAKSSTSDPKSIYSSPNEARGGLLGGLLGGGGLLGK